MLKAARKSMVAVLMLLFLFGCAEGLKTDWKIAEKVGLYLNKSGQLNVSTLPPGADIYLDGAAKGKSPVSLDLSPGDHTIEAKVYLTKLRRLIADKKVTANIGKIVSLEFKLKEEVLINSTWVPFTVFVKQLRGYRSKAQELLENKSPSEAHVVFIELRKLLQKGLPGDVTVTIYKSWERLYRKQIRRWIEADRIGLAKKSLKTYRQIADKLEEVGIKLKEFERRIAELGEKRRIAELEEIRRNNIKLTSILKQARTAEKARQFSRARKFYREALLTESSNRKGKEGLLRVNRMIAAQTSELPSAPSKKKLSKKEPLKKFLKKPNKKKSLKKPNKKKSLKKPVKIPREKWIKVAKPRKTDTAAKSTPGPRSPEVGETFKDCNDCPQMIVVPKGATMMGSPLLEIGRFEDEGPRHKISISRPLAVGIYEVSFKEWDACVSNGGCSYRPEDAGWGRKNQPVINVGWGDAQEYLRWLDKKTGKPYRLLSEAEWEYIARAGTNGQYWWGNDVGKNHANCKGCGSAWDDKAPAPVGSFKKNPFGLYDTQGNVLEWTADCLNGTYEDAPVNGSAWVQGDCSKRVLRGGAWNHDPSQARSASRNADVLSGRDTNVGFRVGFSLE